MPYAARRGIVWVLRLLAVVVVASYAIAGCMSRHPELSGPAHPEPATRHEQPHERRPAEHRRAHEGERSRRPRLTPHARPRASPPT